MSVNNREMKSRYYHELQGTTINGERVPTYEEVKAMPSNQFKNAHPFVKRNCSNCEYCQAVMSWWCTNDEAIKMRGTSMPGVSFCPVWRPNWDFIPDKYKLPEYGYIATPSITLWTKIKQWLHL